MSTMPAHDHPVCEICGGTTELRLVKEMLLCEQCWRAAKDIFRVGVCNTCGRVTLCWNTAGGRLACANCLE